jgi:hypothetical protein
LLAVPVAGGPVTILRGDPITNPAYGMGGFTNPFLAVDDVDVYVLMNNSLVRIPKDGSPATLVNETGGVVQAATVLGGSAFWLEFDTSPPQWWMSILKTSPLQGNGISQLATFTIEVNWWTNFAVTSSTVFASYYSFSLNAANGMTPVDAVPAAQSCQTLTSDTNAVYCSCSASNGCSDTAIASSGAATTLGQAISSSVIVADDTYVYWADETTVGTILKAPKTGGGAIVLAHDANPTAIAVDGASVYWSDQDGYIKRVPK